MHALTSKNYQMLPEVKKKKEMEQKKEDMKRRQENVKKLEQVKTVVDLLVNCIRNVEQTQSHENKNKKKKLIWTIFIR